MAGERTARIVALTVLAGAIAVLLVVVATTILGRPPAAGAAGKPKVVFAFYRRSRRPDQVVRLPAAR